jgi:hypothetical protein
MGEYWMWLGGTTVYIFDYVRGRWMLDDFPKLEALGDAEISVTPVSWDLTPNTWGDWNTSWEQMRPKFSSRMVAALTNYRTITIGEDLSGYEDASTVTSYIETPDFYIADHPLAMFTIQQTLLAYEYNNDKALFEIGISTDKGNSWSTQQHVPNEFGFALLSWKVTGNIVRFRIKTDAVRPVFKWVHLTLEVLPGGPYTGLDQNAS